jgi:hypothetical protein
MANDGEAAERERAASGYPAMAQGTVYRGLFRPLTKGGEGMIVEMIGSLSQSIFLSTTHAINIENN